jgi:gliding motility-associated lipoprotein GldH
MNLKLSIFSIVIIILFASCDDTRVFDEYKNVGDSWHKDSIVSFEFNQKDTVKPYNLFVNLRNNNNYKYSNLFLIVSMEHPNGFTKVDTLQYLMANPDGTLLGDGFADIKESKLYYKEKFKFPKAGKYKVSVQQAVRKTGKVAGEKSLDGINDVGFRIENLESK